MVHSEAVKCPTLLSFELFLVKGLSILLQFVSSCLLLFSDISTLLLGCSVQNLKNYVAEAVIWNVRHKKQLGRINYHRIIKAEKDPVYLHTGLPWFS